MIFTDDSYEENDDLATAPDMGSAALLETGLVACPSDEDWFAFDMYAGETLLVDTYFTHADGDVELQVADSTGAVVAGSYSSDDDESVSWPVAADETFYIVVYLASDDVAPGNTYDLSIDYMAAPTCTDDTFEEDDTLGDATNMGTTAVTETGLMACPSDDDWFEYQLYDGETLLVDVLFTDADGDIDVEVTDDTGAVLDTGASTSDDESLSVPITASGHYYVRVWLVSDDSMPGNTYALSLDYMTTPPPVCTDDAFEENDDLASAPDMGSSAVFEAGLAACPEDDDWYAYDMYTGETLTVDVLFADADGDIDLEVTDASGTVLVDSTSSDDDESVSLPITSTDTYYIHVWLWGGDDAVPGNLYDLSIDYSAAGCTDDGYEPNATQDAAYDLGSTSFSDTGLQSCPDDDDWYSFEMFAGETLEVDVWFTDADGDIELEVYDSAGTVVDSATTSDDNESLSVPIDVTDTYAIRIWLFGGTPVAGNSYDLDVDYVAATCPDDLYENNDADTEAYYLGDSGYSDTGLQLCPSDEDWFEVFGWAGDEITADIYFTDADGDIDMELFDSGGTLIDESATASDDESITWTVSSSDSFFLRVFFWSSSPPAAGNDYDLEVTVTTVGCVDDTYEDNDTQAAAYGITTNNWSETALQACPWDDDWYDFDLYVGETLDLAVWFTHADGDIDVRVYDSAGSVVFSSLSYTDNEFIYEPITVSDTYSIRINLAGGTPVLGNDYDLDVAYIAPSTCTDDSHEPNNNAGAASYLGSVDYSETGLQLCPSDEDWFEIWAATGDEVTVDLWFDDSIGDIDLEIEDDVGGYVTGSASGDDDESVTWTATYTGSHFIRVYYWTSATPPVTGNSYDLGLGNHGLLGHGPDGLPLGQRLVHLLPLLRRLPADRPDLHRRRRRHRPRRLGLGR